MKKLLFKNLTLTQNGHLILAVLLYTCGVWYFFNFTIDDAYISMRYAENFANGNGLVYNPTDDPLEAYSNFIFVLLESLLVILGLKSVIAVKVMSYSFGIGNLLLLNVIGQLILGAKNKRNEIGIILILVATSSPFIIWTVGGLETLQFTFTILAVFTSYLYAEQSKDIKLKSKWYLLGDTLALVVMLSRPEGILFTFGAFVYRVINKSFMGSVYISVLIIIYFIWKWSYFGDLMPTPYYAKAYQIDFLGGIHRAYEFLKINLNFIYIIVLPTIFTTIILKFKQQQYGVQLFAVLFTLIYLLYILSLGYQVSMDDAYRYYVPLIILMAILFFFSINFTSYKLSNGVMISLIVLLVIIRITDLKTAWEKDINWDALNYKVSGKSIGYGLVSGHIALGKWLNENADKNSVIVVHDAGAIPYFSRLRTIDVWSLCDKTMLDLNKLYKAASTKEEKAMINKRKLEYLLQEDPDYIIQDKGIITKSNYAKNYHLLSVEYEYLPWYKLRIYEKNK